MIARLDLIHRIFAVGLAVALSNATVFAEDWPSFAERHDQRADLPPPDGYPEGGVEDGFSEDSWTSNLAERCEAFLNHSARRASPVTHRTARESPVVSQNRLDQVELCRRISHQSPRWRRT